MPPLDGSWEGGAEPIDPTGLGSRHCRYGRARGTPALSLIDALRQAIDSLSPTAREALSKPGVAGSNPGSKFERNWEQLSATQSALDG